MRVYGLSMVLACVSAVIVPVAAEASAPTIESWPTVSSDTIYADDTTVYTVTMTVRDEGGYDAIRGARTVFNLCQGRDAGWDSSYGRGYLAWGVSDAEITQHGGTWVLANADGGGRWGYITNSWGGTTYIAPLSCTTSTSGNATGGPGIRTVTWSFRAKPDWAFNPLVNKADAWASNASSATDWLENPSDFDVVGATCPDTAATPSAPIVSNVMTTTIDVSIDPADSGTDKYLIRIDPPPAVSAYVQADGSLGSRPVWQTRSQWSTTTVTGLLWDTQYTFQARAWDGTTSQCPSGFGPGATVTTPRAVPMIAMGQGTPFSPNVRGQCPYRWVHASDYPALWELTIGAMGRGVGGGLDADTYDWRDINSGSRYGRTGGQFTTLEFLQHARDYDAVPMITANMFGGGYLDETNAFVSVTDNPDGLAADWVRYTNIILQNYRQGDEANMTGEDLRVHNSISDWGGRPQLLAPGEGVVPRVEYWQIGNEPEVDYVAGVHADHYLSPTEYRDRYKLMAPAMLTVDPTIKLGPTLTKLGVLYWDWLPVLAADPDVQIDFVSYHPYYDGLQDAWGDTGAMTAALRNVKPHLLQMSAAVRSTMNDAGRSGYELIASEWNPVSWSGTSVMQASMANAIGIVESVFTFAEDGMLAATFWPALLNHMLGPTGAFTGLVEHMGDVLLLNFQQMGLDPSMIDWRIYATRHSTNEDRVMVWGLNFNENEPVEVDLALGPYYVEQASLMRYGLPDGNTSLMTSSGMAWTEQSLAPESFSTGQFTLALEPAEITLLVLETIPAAMGDFDGDGDVDLDDFGYLQGCLTGTGVPQNDPRCQNARLSGDVGVGPADIELFLDCLVGSGIPADPACDE